MITNEVGIAVSDDEVDADGLTAEDRATLAALEDESLTAAQIENLEKHAAVMVKPSDRSVYGGVPLGTSVEDIPTHMTFTQVTDEGQQTLLTVPFGGRNDKYLAVALKKYAPMIQNASSYDARDRAALLAFEEAAAARQAAESVVPTKPNTPNTPITPTVSTNLPSTSPQLDNHSSVVVGISLGPVGRLDIAFRAAIIERHCLVLVADPPVPNRPGWVPPPPSDPPIALTFFLPDVDVPVRAFPMGLSYSYDGAVHYVLMVDRIEE